MSKAGNSKGGYKGGNFQQLTMQSRMCILAPSNNILALSNNIEQTPGGQDAQQEMCKGERTWLCRTASPLPLLLSRIPALSAASAA